ncbi:MAG: molybdenum cofactor guanylyltransferase [Gammaproteobacteria bacterium]|nr:MAG: molybdenum cofactor guanylyltransferase [Gammaproteobacteria bacterium]
MNPDLLSALILAGGQGRRMNGADKGLLKLEDTAFAERLTRMFRPHCLHVLISCNRNSDIYRQMADISFEDQESGFPGPLQGLESARPHLSTPWLLVTPCDTPRLDARYVTRMTEGLDDTPVSIRVAHDGTRLQNLHLLVHRRDLDVLHEYLERGQRSVWGWLETAGYTPVDFSDCPELFMNVNTPEDLSRLKTPNPPRA